MKKIAIEEHFHTQEYVDYLFSRKEYPKRDFVQQDGKKFIRDWYSPRKFSLMDPDRPDRITDLGEGRIQDMDDAGIDLQVLSLSFPGVELFGPEDGTRVARTVNDRMYEVINQYPERFAGFATIAPQAPEAAADELERAVKELGLKGAIVNGNIRGAFLDEKKYWVILKRAADLDVPVYIHPKMPPEDMVKPYLEYPLLAGALLGFAAEASLHALRLICSGIFDHYPNLKIILGHLGEALPLWLWRLDSRYKMGIEMNLKAAEAYKDLEKTPAQYFRDHFFVTTSGMFWEPSLRFVSEVLGPDKILFAVDYPYESSKEAVQFLESAQIDDESKELISSSNAQRLLRL